MRLYVSGPMSGFPELNFPAFQEATRKLRAAGYEVRDPSENGALPTWEECLRRDLYDVLWAEGVALLPGWEASRGAKLETGVAKELGMPCRAVEEWLEAA